MTFNNTSSQNNKKSLNPADQAMPFLQQGLEHHKNNDFSQAKQFYIKALEIDPNNPNAFYLLGRIAQQFDNHHAAAELFQKAINSQSNVPDFYKCLADSLVFLNNPQEAEKNYLKAMNMKPDQIEYIVAVSKFWREQNQYETALSFLEKNKLFSNNEFLLNEIGLIYHGVGDYEKAIEVYKKILASNEKFFPAINNIANSYKRLGDLETAKKYYEQGIKLGIKSEDLFYNLGNLYYHNKELDPAQDLYEKALQINPRYYPARNNLALIFEIKNQIQMAKEQYIIILNQNPSFLKVYPNLANTFLMLGEVEQAVNLYLNALEQFKGNHYLNAKFTMFAKALHVVTYVPKLEEILKNIYEDSRQDHQLIYKVSVQLAKLKHQDEIPKEINLANVVQCEGFLKEPLIQEVLKKSINSDFILEKRFVFFRRLIVEKSIQDLSFFKKHKDFWIAMAHQSFINEYVWADSSEERQLLDNIESQFETKILSFSKMTPEFERDLIIYGAYRPLYLLEQAMFLAQNIQSASCEKHVKEMFELVLFNPLLEQQEKSKIKRLKMTDDAISSAVQRQYEQNPYPRWLSLTVNPDLDPIDFLQFHAPGFVPPKFMYEKLKILVAGCGTGKHPIQTALRFKNSEIVAVDLSRSSLAYAQRMAKKYEISNISFIQGDLLNLSGLGQTFHIIECTGVLHHMHDPMSGLKSLFSLLEPEGIMYLGLYSTRARETVKKARDYATSQKVQSDLEGIKRFRQEIFDDLNHPLRKIISWKDFYSASEFRDLVLHVQEHTYTPLQIKTMLDQCGLKFLGFLFGDLKSRQDYRNLFPQDLLMDQLENWEEFEIKNPDQFSEMFQFFCQKK